MKRAIVLQQGIIIFTAFNIFTFLHAEWIFEVSVASDWLMPS